MYSFLITFGLTCVDPLTSTRGDCGTHNTPSSFILKHVIVLDDIVLHWTTCTVVFKIMTQQQKYFNNPAFRTFIQTATKIQQGLRYNMTKEIG